MLCALEIDIHTKTYENTRTHTKSEEMLEEIQQTENRLNSKYKQTTSAFALLVVQKWMGNSLYRTDEIKTEIVF